MFTMMYSPIVLLTLLCLVVMSSAFVDLKNKRARRQKFQAAPYSRRDPLGEVALRNLEKILNTLEAVEEKQLDRIVRLEGEANANVAFENDLRGFLRFRLEDQTTRQIQRIKGLQVQVDGIKKLRQRVRRLHRTAEEIRGQVDEAFQDSKSIMYRINDQRNAGLTRQSRIGKLQIRADNLNDRIDALIVKSCDNRVEILDLTTIVKRSIDKVNSAQSETTPLTVSPSGNKGPQAVTLEFETDFRLNPRFGLFGVTALEISRKKSDYPSAYSSFYFSLDVELNPETAILQGLDMSSGDFSVDSVTAIFSTRVFSLKRLPKIH